jgi:hypothetical protein
VSQEIKKEDEICTSSISSSTIPLTSGIEEAPQLLLSVIVFYHNSPAIGNKFLRCVPRWSEFQRWICSLEI